MGALGGKEVGIATRYGLDGPGIESRCGGQDFLPPSRPALYTPLSSTTRATFPAHLIYIFTFTMCIYLFCPMLPHVLVDFVVLPPGNGSSVTDF